MKNPSKQAVDIVQCIYCAIWCIVVLVAAFPKYILDFDVSFLKSTNNLTDDLLKFGIPLIMILIGFLFDFAYTLYKSSPSAEMMKKSFLKALVSIGLAVMLLLLTMYYSSMWPRIILFWMSFVFIVLLKWISLEVTKKEVVELQKA